MNQDRPRTQLSCAILARPNDHVCLTPRNDVEALTRLPKNPNPDRDWEPRREEPVGERGDIASAAPGHAREPRDSRNTHSHTFITAHAHTSTLGRALTHTPNLSSLSHHTTFTRSELTLIAKNTRPLSFLLRSASLRSFALDHLTRTWAAKQATLVGETHLIPLHHHYS